MRKFKTNKLTLVLYFTLSKCQHFKPRTRVEIHKLILFYNGQRERIYSLAILTFQIVKMKVISL